MMTRFRIWLGVGLAAAIAGGAATRAATIITSPDGRLAVEFTLTTEGAPRYAIARNGQPVLRQSKLGLVRDDADFTQGLVLAGVPAPNRIVDEYEILTAKRRINHYVANRQLVRLETKAGKELDIVFEVSNDGVAFRYVFPKSSATVHRIQEEVSSFHFSTSTRAWLQPMSVAKTGWSEVNPCYEEFYEKDVPVGTPSPLAGWVYPALFRTGETWVVITEGSLSRNYCGTRLRSQSPDGEYTVGFPDPRENFEGGPVDPQSTLPWTMPWRIVAIGSLKTIVESTLGTDLAEPAVRPAATPGSTEPVPPVLPGKAAWSWPLLGDANTTYPVQKRFIDYAADMHWRYCLIDGNWDRQIGYEKVKELVDYARTKNVSILLWYNSAGDWNKAPQTPRDLMLTHATRVKEFIRLKAMGVAGLKIDFFGGDGQSVIDYYHDILDDAAPFGFALNFHGATLPRGWQRTYPQLMTMEAVKGFEYITFDQKNADEEPVHATILPFARNLFDPMDFTPMALDGIPHIQRRTTSGFELALSVVFTSGIQHYVEIPEGMAKAPDYVRDFLRHVPAVWDDTKFLDGFPGRYVMLARRGDGKWYVAGINGEPHAQTLTLDLGELSGRMKPAGILITDGGEGGLGFRQEKAKPDQNNRVQIALAPYGGFVAVFE